MTELALVHREPPIRWPNLISALQDAGYSLRDIGGALAVPHATVRSWQIGRPGYPPSQPNYEDGRALLRLFDTIAPTLKHPVRIW